MDLEFSGSTGINAPPEKAYSFLTDMRSVAMCVPGSSNFKSNGDKAFSLDVKINLGAVGGTFMLDGTVEETSGSGAAYRIKGHSAVGETEILLSFDLRESGSGTLMLWKADFILKGLVTGVGEGVINNISNEKIREIINNVKSRIETG